MIFRTLACGAPEDAIAGKPAQLIAIDLWEEYLEDDIPHIGMRRA